MGGAGDDMKRLGGSSGLTLIEVLVVLALVAILTPALVRLTLQAYRLHEMASTRVRERERVQEVLEEIVHGFEGDEGKYPGLTGVSCDSLTQLPDGFRYAAGSHRVTYRVEDRVLQRQVDARPAEVLMPGFEKVEASCDAERLVTVNLNFDSKAEVTTEIRISSTVVTRTDKTSP